MGTRQDGTALGDVALPLWARGSAWKVTRTMRHALESPHVSRELPGWIDLVFGCLQQGDGAAGALNRFLPCTYVGAVDLQTLEDENDRTAVLSQIQMVGQTPEQLWTTRRHPSRTNSASANTAPPTPLLGALGAGQRLQSSAEGPSGPPVYALLVLAGGERATPLPRDVASLARAQLVVRWGFVDGSVRFYRQRSVGANNATPVLHCARLHGGEPIVAAGVSADGTWLVTGDALGELAVWRVRHRSSQPSLRAHGRLCGHRASIRRLSISGTHRALTSVDADGIMIIWDVRKGLLLHMMRVCPSPRRALAATGPKAMPREAALPLEAIPAVCAIEETGETLVATLTQLQLWSVNGSLLAVSGGAFGSAATSAVLLRTPEWMVEQLPIVATGHADGTVRMWTVREPLRGCTLAVVASEVGACASEEACPRAISRLPVRSHVQPAWELYEMRSLRLDRPADAATTAAAAIGACAITALAVGDGFEKLLWTASADGRVRAWRAPAQAQPTSADASAAATSTGLEVEPPLDGAMRDEVGTSCPPSLSQKLTALT